MSQQGLAALAGITQGTVSKLETGVVPASTETLSRIASALDYPTALFLDSEPVYDLDGGVFHRRRATTPVTRLRQLRAQVNLMRIHIERLLSIVDLETDLDLHRIDLEQYGSPEAAAGALRAYWRLPVGPIGDLIGTLEAAGAIVQMMRFPTAKVDAASQWPPRSPAPFFFLNDEFVGERIRMTLAHELAHMVAHVVPGEAKQEDEANRFAAAFLMPPDEIQPDLRGLTLARAFTLKPYWKVSAAAIIRHAYSIGAITHSRYTSLFQQLSRHGYRRAEPNPLAPETPRLLRRVIDYCTGTLGYSIDELAAVVRLTTEDFRTAFMDDGERPRLRVVPA
jgi:Zn-dependent peptidase ImmA (M78 family)/transcriptional regulator with XRE-family HTH domain